MIDKLEMFLALAQEEHFGRAAESLGLAQPTLSAGIKQLEAQLGVQLVWRGSRFRGLTPEGQRVLVWSRQIVGDARTMRDEMRAVRNGLSGTVRLAVIPTSLAVASQLTADFCRDNPNVNVTLTSRTSAEILAMIENLEADAGITYLDNEPLGRLTAVPLYMERYALVCGPDAPLADRDEVGWDEVDPGNLCLLTPDMQNRRIINQNCHAVGIDANPRIESNSTVALMAHVDNGWSTILPLNLARFLARGRDLRTIPIRQARQGYSVGLIAPYREPHTPILEALLRRARRLADADPGTPPTAAHGPGIPAGTAR
ncbi:LysR family transcriptional regulator [Marinibacterium profundimaris]|uniref:LysR family transcriptional regulator n=1 Tax=Marinibacterium profundimaris TaxID=1679460 RepID=UPI000B526840|nr:LysR family transcriptional regulator [Marinibacterium profundimaris]